MKKKILWLFLSCIMALTLVAWSCGGGEAGEEEEEEEEEEGPHYGGHLHATYSLQPSSLDPVLGTSGGDAQYFKQMYDQLVDADRNFVPDPSRSLAESWEFPDDTTIIFHLREGVKFHDGTDFNADAVKFNIERIQDPETAATPRASFMVISNVEVINDYTVAFHLNDSWGAGIGLLSDRGGAMNSPTAVQQLGEDYGVNVVGTGPFKLEEYVAGSYVRMVRNEDYWGKDSAGNQLPYLDELTITVISDEAVRSAALEAGELDVAQLPLVDIERFEADPNVSITTFEGADIAALISFNISVPPLDDVNLRKAIAYAINPEPINDALYFGRATVAKGGIWCPGTWVYDETVPRPYYDPDLARAYLELGGYPEGFEVDAITFTDPTIMQQAEMYQAQLAEVGIIMNFDVFDTSTTASKFYVTQEYPMLLHRFSRYPEPDWKASLLFKSTGYYNPAKLPNPVMDNLIERGAATYDIAERKSIYRQVMEIVLGECWSVPYLYNTYYYGYWQDKVGGIDTLFGWDAKQQFRQIWLKP